MQSIAWTLGNQASDLCFQIDIPGISSKDNIAMTINQ
jgi:hypothetical protein